MKMLQAAILGLIQGLTEFLPVSSSGHLTLAQTMFGLSEGGQSFAILLHVATLVAVFVVFWPEVSDLLRHPFQRTTALLIAGTIPTVIIALIFGDTIDKLFAGGRLLGVCFIITGIVLLLAGRIRPGKKKIRNLSIFDALVIGVFQGVAICPAISRSGMTLTGALSRGLNRKEAAHFSFLLSILAILGALVLDVAESLKGGTSAVEAMGVAPTIIGFVVAAVSGYFALRFMLKIVEQGKLRYFSYYVFALGALVLIDQNLTHFFFAK